ncbi:hypothetical protein MBLNU459_g3505t2 [Dothideomycetes sp. NU459]
MPVIDRLARLNPLSWFSKPDQTVSFALRCKRILQQRMNEQKLGAATADANRPADFTSAFLEAQGKDPSIGDGQLIGYAKANLTAGSDTTSVVLRTAVYYSLKQSWIAKRIAEEVDSKVSSFPVPYHTARFELPFCAAVVRESLRKHFAFMALLEREVPAGGCEMPDGTKLPAGVVIGMHGDTIGLDKDIFGENADVFDPLRWLPYPGELQESFEKRLKAMNAHDLAFGRGTRSCIGRHVAEMEIYKFIPTFFGLLELNRTASPVPQSNSTPLPGGALLTTDEADAITVATSVVGQVPKPSVNDWGEIRPLATPVSVQEAIRPNQEIEPALWAFPTTAATSDGRYYGVPATRRGDLLWSIPYEEHEVDCAGSLPVVSPPDSISFQNPASKSSGASAGIFGTLCFGGSTGNSSSTLPDQDTPIALRRLGQVYLDHVDPVVKILHRPSLRKLLQHDSTYLGYPEHHTSVIALSSAICYVATCSLSETECRDMFQTSKITVVTQYRQACETSLDRAEVLVTEDMTALQAFVLYLVGRRAEGQEKVVWSLIPLAIRLAKGMSLHTDAAMTTPMRYRTESFFDQQMRKRLWLTICVLDLQASFAHGSEPLVPVAEVSSALEGLRHLDDADFDEQTTDEIPQREDLTCATLAFVTYHAQVSGRFLNYDGQEQQRQCEDVDLPSSGGDSVVRRPSSSASSIHVSGRKDSLPNPFSSMAREGALAAFERKAFELIRFCDPEASRQAWLTWHKTQILVSTTRLAALRPFPSILTSQERVNDVDLHGILPSRGMHSLSPSQAVIDALKPNFSESGGRWSSKSGICSRRKQDLAVAVVILRWQLL